MATYLQGVTDYIPQFQPFQPDLNFYGNVMQTKQTQYDTNWKALNKMYGQYYHADLTKDSNIAKKDNYLKQIEFNLQRVSQLDLSLEQNVDQATQIFKPFYEDKGLMKDMAFTKNNMNQVSYGQSLKNAYNQVERDRYWNEGILELQYKRQEFKESTDEEAMSFEDTDYTSNVDVIGKAQETAKAAGLSIETVEFSKDGKFIVKNKNGEQLIEPLQKLFEAKLGSDPSVQAKYKTLAYVDRKNYAEYNAAQFKGDKNAAEMEYLETNFNRLKAQNIARFNALKATSASYDAKMQNIKNQIDKGQASPDAKLAYDQYKMNKDINDEVLARAEQEQKELSSGQNAASSTGFINPYGDIKSLRYKVDNAMASSLMQKDLDEAANIFAFKDAKQDIDANPYAVLAEKHKYSMSEIAARNAGLERAAALRNAGERKNKLDEYGLKIGTHYRDEKTGEVKPVSALNEIYTEFNDKGISTDKYNMKTASDHINNIQSENVAKPFLKNTLTLMQDLVNKGQMTQEEASKILSYGKNPKISINKFNDKLDKYGAQWLRTEVGPDDLKNIQKRMDTWISQNGELSGLSGEDYKSYQMSALKFDDYANYLKADIKWRKESSKVVVQDLYRQGYKNAEFLYDEKGNKRSEKEFTAALIKANKIKKSDKYSQPDKINFAPLMSSEAVNEKAPTKAQVDYNELVNAAAGVYSSGKVKAPEGFGKLGKMTGSGLSTGNVIPGANTTWVNPKAHGTKSTVWAAENFRTLANIDWADDTKNRGSLTGINKESWNNHDAETNAKVKSVFDLIKAELTKPNTKMANFRMTVSPIAAGSLNKSAITVYPDAEWLKTYVKSGEKNTGPGVLTTQDYNNAIQNGFSYIVDSKTLANNSMYMAAFQSPLEAHIKANKKYEYVDPRNPNYKLSIAPNKLGTSDYTVIMGYPLYNPNLGKYEYRSESFSTSTLGGNLETAREMGVSALDSMWLSNKNLNNGRY
jgi:polyhydroxyalkanoate synthesis regulator phasin